mmetsp:Transcript_36751/g.97515  ORF Transcript_36751/g.97515 Transcript_36751/m.97515 type:complete len:246 (+) Transcript_36751:149-886(+)
MISPSATILSTISMKNTIVKMMSRTTRMAILALMLQQPGCPCEPQGGNALPKKGPSSRGQLTISACPSVEAPEQSRKPGAGGQFLSDDTTMSSGASRSRVMEEARMIESIIASITGLRAITAAHRLSGFDELTMKKALWSGTEYLTLYPNAPTYPNLSKLSSHPLPWSSEGISGFEPSHEAQGAIPVERVGVGGASAPYGDIGTRKHTRGVPSTTPFSGLLSDHALRVCPSPLVPPLGGHDSSRA